jgi:hypothetical protein
MSKEFGERLYEESTSQREARQESEHAGNNRLPSLLQDEDSWSERTHEEMVDILRSSMERYRLDRDPESRWFDSVNWMREQLCFEMAKKSAAANLKISHAADMPHARLLLAWEIISLPHLRSQFNKNLVETAIRDKARILGHTVTLDSNESKLLDVMADACGIPYEGEQKNQSPSKPL